MLGYPRFGRGTRPPVYSMCNAADEPCPLYDSRVGYTNGTLHFGDRDGLRKDGTTRKDGAERSTLPFGDRDGFDSRKDGTTRKDGTERSTLPFGARDGLRTTLHFGITDGLIRKRKGTHLRTSSDQRGEKERVDQTSDPPGPDNQPKRPCGTPWRTRPLTTVMSGTGRING